MHVLGIETSCDETGVAAWDSDSGLVWERLFSQIDLHAEYGGVVPELAARDHLRRLAPMVETALAEGPAPDVVAYTAGPGLVGALLVGAALGQALAAGRGIPAIGINHLEAHLLAPLMSADALDFPFVALLVSGGHTLLVETRGLGDYKLLGTTLDDAVGEAFDKTASLLDLPYPGGPELAKLAATSAGGRFKLPRPLLDRPGCDFSFSGLKTAALYAARELEPDDQAGRAALARDFEEAVVDTLVAKCKRALDSTGLDTLIIAGGVAANRRLRERLTALPGTRVCFPDAGLCTDNGAMIAYAGWLRWNAGERQACDVRARWPLESLRPPAGPGLKEGR